MHSRLHPMLRDLCCSMCVYMFHTAFVCHHTLILCLIIHHILFFLRNKKRLSSSLFRYWLMLSSCFNFSSSSCFFLWLMLQLLCFDYDSISCLVEMIYTFVCFPSNFFFFVFFKIYDKHYDVDLCVLLDKLVFEKQWKMLHVKNDTKILNLINNELNVCVLVINEIGTTKYNKNKIKWGKASGKSETDIWTWDTRRKIIAWKNKTQNISEHFLKP